MDLRDQLKRVRDMTGAYIQLPVVKALLLWADGLVQRIESLEARIKKIERAADESDR